MYPGHYATANPDRPAFVMAASGNSVNYAEFEARANQLAHLFRKHGLKPEDHYSIFMENNDRYLEACAAGERAGLYYTCINSFLTAEEVAYILTNSESKLLITSHEKLEIALEAQSSCPKVQDVLVVNAPADANALWASFNSAVAQQPTSPIANECLGGPMLYSSGTTGRPKGIMRELGGEAPLEASTLMKFLNKLWHYREDMVYLSPAPLYHSAPQAAVNLTIRIGGTVVIMERFEPILYLQLIERYSVTHSQLVPTMFNRLLKLPIQDRERFDLSSLEIAVHAAAPCPIPIKEQMIEWWGPIIHEYYGATEGLGFTICDTEQWLSHRGTVGKVVYGDLHILDDEMKPLPLGEPGTIWFESGSGFTYYNDPEKTQEAQSPDGRLATVGDVGFLDDDNFLYLTDRKSFMIISGGVNVYPQEIENLLVTHPMVADAAVFGIPNADLGEEVKAVVQVIPEVIPNDELASELQDFCAKKLSRQKVPRSIDFDPELPRLPTGKLYKHQLRDRYWDENNHSQRPSS